MGHVRLKTRPLGQILEKLCVYSRDHILVVMKSQMSLKMGHVGLKTRSFGQMLEKPFARSRGNIFSPIIMILGQTFFLEKILNEYENESCGVKN